MLLVSFAAFCHWNRTFNSVIDEYREFDHSLKTCECLWSVFSDASFIGMSALHYIFNCVWIFLAFMVLPLQRLNNQPFFCHFPVKVTLKCFPWQLYVWQQHLALKQGKGCRWLVKREKVTGSCSSTLIIWVVCTRAELQAPNPKKKKKGKHNFKFTKEKLAPAPIFAMNKHLDAAPGDTVLRPW